MAKSRTCLACKTHYSYCPDCSRADALKPTWYSEFCSEACKDLWLTLTRYNMKRLTKDDAKSIILGLDLKPIDSYVDCVQRDYKKVMAAEKKPRRGRRAEIKVFDEVADIEPEMIKLIVEEQVAEETTLHEVVLQKEN